MDGDFQMFSNIYFGWHFLWFDVFSDFIERSAWSNILYRNKWLYPTSSNMEDLRETWTFVRRVNKKQLIKTEILANKNRKMG